MEAELRMPTGKFSELYPKHRWCPGQFVDVAKERGISAATACQLWKLAVDLLESDGLIKDPEQ